MSELRQITPFVFTHDLAASCDFYESLGLAPRVLQPELGYAYCTNGRVALRVLELGSDQEIAEQMIYIDVDDVDAVYAELKPVLDALPEGRARAPFNQDYGMREFHVKDPDNCLLLYGAAISGS